LRPDQVNNFILGAGKRITKLRKELAPYPALIEKVLKPLSEQIDRFNQDMPLVTKLRHPGIKTKHWEMISKIVGFPVVPSNDLSLQEILQMDLGRWSEQINELAGVAAQEYNIESSLDQMEAELSQTQMHTKPYKETGQFILVDIADVESLIDDQLVTTQTLLTSPFIAPSKKRAVEHLAFLRTCSESLEAWIECQRGWLYLQPIFTGTSIQQKLFREARDWKCVDTKWSAIMKNTTAHPDFVNVMHRDQLLEDLKMCNQFLDSITQGLNAYLESKRHGFPRFFFLSNDELIAILSHTKDFDCIQKSMQKLFEYIATITVNEELVISHMNDDGLESVKLLHTVDGDTAEIEDWLNSFETEMKLTLKDQIKLSLPASEKAKRDVWLGQFPAQCILIANQILWTQQVSLALQGQRLRGLKVLQSKFIEGLEDLTSMIRKALTPAIRQVVSCLLILEVHNRDIITDLVKREVADEDSFKWNQQLRYYWEDETVQVRSINNNYEYSYEYAGNSARLVITPLTDRCYQTLLSAFRQNLSGAPSGPAGTGKTETVRDCAKALGRSCVVYNCSEEVTPEQMSQFFAGLASSGSWSCFDEFNRINIEVLSVIAQQVRTIQEAIAAHVDTFLLDARTLKINANAAVCITMNPGYAGRTELPDNLKALFRPCAMMVPDFGFIAEIMLFSGGFASASVLSVKLVALFDLCRKQLSNAHHYDWGLRAMKAILSTAGKSKRAHLQEREALLLVQAIRDNTRARLVSVDVPLFEGIIHDVFPDVDVHKTIGEALTNHLTRAFKEAHVQPLPLFLLKCAEIYETTIVRHGVMLVGGALGGKTTCWKALQQGLSTYAREEGIGKAVRVENLNPKSITIPELYGLFDPVTSGWNDGILSKFIRECSMGDSTEYNWIIVDGPVDSLWIETMNSLLDDNKVLCLSNNERIALGSHVRLMFEVDDLSQASPATVSRCGMIYFDPSSVPWAILTDSWLQQISDNFDGLRDFLKVLIEAYVPMCIQFIEMDAKVAIGGNPRYFVHNLLRLLDCFNELLRVAIIKPPADGDDAKEIDPLVHSNYFSPFLESHDPIPYLLKESDQRLVFERVFIFALIWSFGSVLADVSRSVFDNLLKSAM
jgi:MoxR-like ATPase